MRFLTVQEVVDMHDETLHRTGGESGMLAPSSLASAIDRHVHGPFHGRGDLVERAAYLFRGIVQDHPFVDGNKRTAVEAAWNFLRNNDVALIAPPGAIVDFSLAAARGLPISALEDWLRRHAQRLNPRNPKEDQ